MGKSSISFKFREYHRYLGFFLAGIMSIYAFSGTVLIFRTTDFLKFDRAVERELSPNLTQQELGGALFMRDFQVVEETDNTIIFNNEGVYNKTTGIATFQAKELPTFIQNFVSLHKATVDSPMFYLNIFFGVSLLFFSVSAFFMYALKSKKFKVNMYVAIAGVIFAIVVVML